MLWSVIYSQLKSEGFDVYSPGQHLGDCVSPYVVVRSNGSMQYSGFTTDVVYCDVLCYVPIDHYSQLEKYVARVKAALRKLYPQVKEAHMETNGFIDESNKSHMWSIQYQSYRQFYNNFS